MTTDLSWYRRRGYLHFDASLNLSDASSYVKDPNRVAEHAFYPFLAYDIFTPRMKKSTNAAGSFFNDPKIRGISYPAHKDGYIFSYYKFMLEALYENWLETHNLGKAVTAFRKTGENNVTLAKSAFDFIAAHSGCHIVATDVESFFDTISHAELKKIWARFLGLPQLPEDHYSVFKAITHYSVVPRHKVFNLFGMPLKSRRSDRAGDPNRLCTPKQFRDRVVRQGLIQRNHGLAKGGGIPQGSSLSPLLSNMYMGDLDIAMHSWTSSLGGAYWRYCDDILIVMPAGKRPPILSTLDKELKKLSLKRSMPKTQNLNGNDLSTREQIQYLGLIFNGTDIMVRSSSIHRYHRKVKKGIYAARKMQEHETVAAQQPAPLRQQALYNRYSELPLRGKNITERRTNRKFSRNFIEYLQKTAITLNSPQIERQRRRLLKRFRSSIRKYK